MRRLPYLLAATLLLGLPPAAADPAAPPAPGSLLPGGAAAWTLIWTEEFDLIDDQHNFARDYHTYGLEWTERELVFYFNGKELRREKNEFCHSPAPVWLSLAIIGWGGKITDAIDGTFMEVDHVRIYRPE